MSKRTQGSRAKEVAAGTYDPYKKTAVAPVAPVAPVVPQPTSSSTKSVTSSGIMQSTAQQERADLNAVSKLSNYANLGANQVNIGTAANPNIITNGKPANQPAAAPQTNTADAPLYTTADGKTSVSDTPTSSYSYTSSPALAEGEKFGYDKSGMRYIIGKDNVARTDTFAKQEYEANKTSIAREQERKSLYDSMKKTLDSSHVALLDSITSTYAARKQKMADINQRYLSLKTRQGFTNNAARYAAEANTDVLLDEELSGQSRLAEIDAQEKTLIAQAVSAKGKADMELLQSSIKDIDALRAEKEKTIQGIYKAAVDYNKALDDKDKELRILEKATFDQNIKKIDTAAPGLRAAYSSLKKPADQNKFIEEVAKKFGLEVEVVAGAIQNSADELRKDLAKNKSTDAGEDFGAGADAVTSPLYGQINKMIESNFKNSNGTPIVDEKGFFTAEAFKDLLKSAVNDYNIPRNDFIQEYKDKIYLKKYKYAKNYGLTEQEFNKIKSK